MWKETANSILKYRIFILIGLVVSTLFMGYYGRNVKMSYEFMRIIPETDSAMIAYEQFREKFGEDANSFVIGVKDPALFKLENFKKFKALGDKLTQLKMGKDDLSHLKMSESAKDSLLNKGINGVISPANLYYLSPDRVQQKFELKKFFPTVPDTQAQLDSILNEAHKIKFYENTIFGKDGATLMAVSMDPSILNSEARIPLMEKLMDITTAFEEDTGIHLYYAGLPYVRAIMADQVKSELTLFLMLSAAVTALVLFLFFRSISAVVVPLTMIGVIVVWIMGTLGLLGYKITILTGLLPPVLIVIGIPNSIYLLNKYHQEYSRSRDKRKALTTVIKKIGVVTLITNTTTAIGFCVLVLTGISAMQEFGIVAGINIAVTFVISILFIPAVFSYLPEPDTRHLKHLNFKGTQGIIHLLEVAVTHYRKVVYIITAIIIVISFFGAYKIKAVSHMVDDLPEDFHVKSDLRFFEEHFKGVMPLEIVVNTQKKKGFRRNGVLEKVDEIQQYLASNPEITPAVSLVTLLKTANQAFYGGDTVNYRLPSRYELAYIMKYLGNQTNEQKQISTNFSDSTGQYLRLSMKVADIGSIEMDTLVNRVTKKIEGDILKDTDLTVDVTGTTLIFIKGNEFLIKNLKQSMLIAFVLIAIIMGTLFGNLRIVIISLIPNLIPLLFTAGIMGYFGVPLKPSTAIIFSIAFGISVDDSIHFLAKYRQEMKLFNGDLKKALIVSIRETGTSMLYTSIVLFFGFIIFIFSAFGGTIALGLLTSITLLVAMITNLILLPSLLYTFDVRRTDLKPIVEGADEFYFEDEDEEIDLSMIRKEDEE
ncbi:MMPL family transporter [Limibacter armeniacum]|uniref:efflux RND transporter permease subunit n=1 Tax=Limibacter armeniacum TaxID=466084 RepID=UPI002FE4FF23